MVDGVKEGIKLQYFSAMKPHFENNTQVTLNSIQYKPQK